MIVYTNHINKLQENHSFLIYSGTSDKNLMFLGSCRMIPLMYYYHQIMPEYNIYGIYVPFWEKEQRINFPKKNIDLIMQNTEIIFTETTKNFGILNTDHSITDNFFSTFHTNANLKEFRITNLELSLYAYDIKYAYKKSVDSVTFLFDNSINRMKNSLTKYEFFNVIQFIEKFFTSVKLFNTLNHPTTILSLLIFKNLISKMGLDHRLNFKLLKNISQNVFLGGNATPITRLDIDNYGFTFPTKIYDNSVLEIPNVIYKPPADEELVTDDLLDIVLNNKL